MKIAFVFAFLAFLCSIRIRLCGMFAPASAMGATPAPQRARPLYCASDDWKRQYCPMNRRAGVQLFKQRSDSACLFGQTWGKDGRGVWVDRGCRADFEIGQAGWQPRPSLTIYCASDSMRRNYCRADTSRGGRTIRQRSDADRIYNRTWGYHRGSISRVPRRFRGWPRPLSFSQIQIHARSRESRANRGWRRCRAGK